MKTHPRRRSRFPGWMLPLLSAAVLSAPAAAHEVRPAYLELTEVSAGRFEVLWKQPVLADAEPGLVRRLPLRPVFPAHCRETGRALPELTAAALLERWTIDCGAEGLGAEPIEIAGLPRTLTDVLLRVRFADGVSVDHLLRPEAPRVVVSPEGGGGMAVPAYLRLGVEHLLFGFDHILFVIGLMFLVRRPLQLVQVVTAFTAAHSITLALSTLGVLTLSQRPVEAVIALSILYLAVELARGAGRDHHTNGAGAFTNAGGADRDQHASGAGAFTQRGRCRPRPTRERGGRPHRRGLLPGAFPVGHRVRVRPAARVRLRGGAGRHRPPRAGAGDGPAAVQRRGRNRAVDGRRRPARLAVRAPRPEGAGARGRRAGADLRHGHRLRLLVRGEGAVDDSANPLVPRPRGR